MPRPRNYEAPHVAYERSRRFEAERAAHEATLEAKYGVPYDKLPSILVRGAPEHPRAKNARRFRYRVYDHAWRRRWDKEEQRRRARKGKSTFGWRTERKHFLDDVERFRQAEVEVRKLRAVKKGRGKPLPKNHFTSRRDAVERRDFAEKNW